MSFLNSIKNNSKQYNFPFNHWEYSNALSEEAIDEIVKADIPDVSKLNLNYDGTRAIDGGAAEFREGIASGGQAIKFRCFINKENSTQFPNLTKFIEELRSPEVYKKIGSLIGKDLSNSFVRLEVICDREGFWLKPHCDIEEKLMSSIFLILAIVTCLIVLIILMFGIGSFAKGGNFGRKYSNKLMRWRIIAQAVAVLLIIVFVYFEKKG